MKLRKNQTISPKNFFRSSEEQKNFYAQISNCLRKVRKKSSQ